MKRNAIALLALILVVSISACKKKAVDPVEVPSTNTVSIEFEHVFGSSNFNLNTTDYYIANNGDSMIFTTLKYYVSNVKLKKSDGSYWKQKDSYYLIDKADASSTLIEIPEVPAGEYTELVYTVGVDSTRNVSGAQDGALSTSNGMFWSWNTGYIFLKAEGNYRHGSGSTGSFMYHVGGFKNSNNTNAIREVVHDLSTENLSVSKTAAPEVHLSVDVATLFNGGPTAISVPSMSTVHMPGANAITVSNNYQTMFSVEHIHQ